MVAFDEASVIAEFIAEPERTTLELPHLTTGQRKQVKTLLQEYPELRCESYGFGQERRLHIFRKGCEPDIGLDNSSGTNDTNRQIYPVPLPVRNTFIHINETADERAIQSMPHGMFRQNIFAESAGRMSGKVEMPSNELKVIQSYASTSEPEAEPVTHHTAPAAQGQSGQRVPLPLSIGALVVVEGLTKLPAFNGLSAVVQGWDETTGRYSIMLASAAGGCQQAKVKEENLRLLLPCPDATA
jgi:hypothetical protein